MLIFLLITLAAIYLLRHIYLQFKGKGSCAKGCGNSCSASSKIDWKKIEEQMPS